MNAPGYGAAFKKGVFDPVTSVALAGFGEALARWDNFVEIDKSVVDKFGIPVLRLTMSWGENEKKLIPAMAQTATEMMEAAGAKNITPFQVPNRVPGYGIHEMGTARMGRDPKTSVLNAFNQVHACKNVYVTDGAAMASSSCVNPSLTYMALTARAADHAAQAARRGDL
jgi:choline dehydrogenase-like flavoprotein